MDFSNYKLNFNGKKVATESNSLRPIKNNLVYFLNSASGTGSKDSCLVRKVIQILYSVYVTMIIYPAKYFYLLTFSFQCQNGLQICYLENPGPWADIIM